MKDMMKNRKFELILKELSKSQHEVVTYLTKEHPDIS